MSDRRDRVACEDGRFEDSAADAVDEQLRGRRGPGPAARPRRPPARARARGRGVRAPPRRPRPRRRGRGAPARRGRRARPGAPWRTRGARAADAGPAGTRTALPRSAGRSRSSAPSTEVDDLDVVADVELRVVHPTRPIEPAGHLGESSTQARHTAEPRRGVRADVVPAELPGAIGQRPTLEDAGGAHVQREPVALEGQEGAVEGAQPEAKGCGGHGATPASAPWDRPAPAGLPADDLGQARLEAPREQVGVAHRGAVARDPDAAGVEVRDERHAQRRADRRREGPEPLDLSTGQVSVASAVRARPPRRRRCCAAVTRRAGSRCGVAGR